MRSGMRQGFSKGGNHVGATLAVIESSGRVLRKVIV